MSEHTPGPWEQHELGQRALIEKAIARVRAWCAESRDPERAFAMLARPYRRLLDQIDREGLPYARRLDAREARIAERLV